MRIRRWPRACSTPTAPSTEWRSMPDQLRWGRRVLLVCSTAARMVMFSRMRTSSQSSYVGGRGRPGEPAASWHWVSFCSFSKVCGTFPIIRRSVRRSSAGWQPKGIELIAFDYLKPENRTRWKPYRLLETDLISDNLPTLPHRSIHFPLMSHPERSFAGVLDRMLLQCVDGS